MRRPVRTKLSSASPAAMFARQRGLLLLAALLPSTTHAAPLCNRSLPVCVVRDNVTVNYADACDGVYAADPPSCTWNSTNQSLVIAANVTVRCDQPSTSDNKDSCKLDFDFALLNFLFALDLDYFLMQNLSSFVELTHIFG